VTDEVPKYCWSCPKREMFERAGRECPSSPRVKAELRRTILGSLSSMTPEVRRQKSLLIVKHLLELPEFKRAGVVMAYVAMEMEVDPWSLIREAWALGKRVAMPRVHPSLENPQLPEDHDLELLALELHEELVDDPQDHSGLRPDVMGILEPKTSAAEIPIAEIDLVVVPCVAFDRQGWRLGRGGGFYDRFLSREDLRAASCGLAFSEQVFSTLPQCPHDRAVDIVTTESGVLRADRGG